MDYLVIDLEATCWDDNSELDRMEIIEIGAVLLDGKHLLPKFDFSCFVRPTREPLLSEFCKQLTGIKQSQVDRAETFPNAFAGFLNWAGPADLIMCSWGDYDRKHLLLECQRHKVPVPEWLERHINLKAEFAASRCIRPCGMSKALKIMGLPLKGSHHRALDDAKNIAELARFILEPSNMS